MIPIRTSTGAIPNVSAQSSVESDSASSAENGRFGRRACSDRSGPEWQVRVQTSALIAAYPHTRVKAPRLDIPTSSRYRYCCLWNGTVLGVFAYFRKLCGRLTLKQAPAAIPPPPVLAPGICRCACAQLLAGRGLKGSERALERPWPATSYCLLFQFPPCLPSGSS